MLMPNSIANLSMKILIVNKLYHPWIGGIETVTKDIAEGLLAKGHEVEVLACVPSGTGKEEVIAGVPVHKAASFGILFSMPISFDFFIKFRKLARKTDVILIQHPFPLGTIAQLLFAGDTPTAVWYHSDIERQKMMNLLFSPFLKASLKKAKVIFIASKGLAEHSRYLPAFRTKWSIISFGVDLEKFRATPPILARATEIRKHFGSPLVLSVGRMVPYKGFEYLIRAMKSTQAHLLIIGNGPLRKNLEKIVYKEKLAEKVSFLDRAEDLVPYYHACELFVLSSIYRTEAFGIVQEEALACGKPVVNTNLPTGVPEISVDGITGYTVPPADAAALAEAITKIISDPTLLHALGDAAQKRAREKFSREYFFATLEAALLAL